MRRTSRNEEIDRKDVGRSVENFRMIAKGAARDRTSAYRDDNFRVRHRLVGFLEGETHVLSHGAGNQKSIRMAWGRNELNPEPAEVVHDGIQNVNVRLASVASAGTDLSEFERASKDPMGLIGQTLRQSQRFLFAQDQIIPIAGRESILRRESDRSFGACVGALGAEKTATEIDL